MVYIWFGYVYWVIEHLDRWGRNVNGFKGAYPNLYLTNLSLYLSGLYTQTSHLSSIKPYKPHIKTLQNHRQIVHNCPIYNRKV